MTGLKGNSEFCFPETLNVPQGEVFCYTPQLKNGKKKKKLRRNRLLDAGWLTNCRGFDEHDLHEHESKVQVVFSLGS